MGWRTLLLKVHAVPKARKADVVKIDDETFEVRVDETAERGRANRRLLEIMSDYFDVPKSELALVSGARARNKVIMVAS